MFDKLIERLYLKQKGNLVYYDSLTGVYSRMYYDRVMKEKYLSKHIYVYFIDLDNLKGINDNYGHAAGSRAILNVADQLKKIEGLYDIVRIGGDEFLAISDNVCSFTIEGASIGFSEKEEFESIVSACVKADTSMYHAKNERFTNVNQEFNTVLDTVG